ncbi:MAG: FtsX-like permease family protein [Tissierellaceae bacterium]|nr:FtsX-like permease family protein [Tissierellaceae bacterium]
MKKSALVKDALRDILKSKGRFFSILAIIVIGVAFFSGLKIAPQDMKYTADKYFDDYNLMDIRIVSNLGLTKDDLVEIKKLESIEDIKGSNSLDALTLLNEKESVIRIHSYASQDQINGMKLIEGRYPQKSNEVLAEAGKDLISNIPLNSKVNLYSGTDKDLSDDLENTEFTVVGTVQVPYYLSFEKGNSAIGNGRVSSYIIIPQENFKSDIFTDIYLTVEGAREINSYTEEYFEIIDPVVARLEELAEFRQNTRYDEIIDEATEKLEDGKSEYYEGKAEADKELADALIELEDAEIKILDGERELEKEERDFYRTIQEGKDKLKQAELDLVKGEEELDKAFRELNDKKEQAEEQFSMAELEIQKGEEAVIMLQSQVSELKAALENPLLPEEQRNKLSLDFETAKVMLEKTKDSVENGILELNAGKQALIQGEEELNRNRQILMESRDTIEQEKINLSQGERTGIRELNKAKEDLNQARIDLEEGIEEYNKAKLEVEEELEEAWNDILEAEKDILDIPEGKWYVLDRESHYSYMDYKGAADRIDAIAGVFPLFFALVAALVCLTTMTRMVDEQRGNIGTLKALGYGKGDIAFKYILYAFIATLVGCIFGIAIGYTVFPTVIFNAYGIMYILPTVQLLFDYKLAIGVSAVAIILTTFTTYSACSNELKENTATLMRPKAPRIGKTVFLEKIPFLWNRLHFSHKITIRNLLRYKRRFLMTVFGIAGCTALLLTGFGVRDSIRAVVDRQFGEIFIYDITLGLEEVGVDNLSKYAEIKDFALLQREGGSLSFNGINKDISIVVPENSTNISEFIRLRDPKTKEKINIPDEGLIITKQISNSMDIKIGDKVVLINNKDEEKEVEIIGITENYTSNYAYISNEYYVEIFSKELEYNEAIGHVINMTRTVEDKLSRDLLSEEGIVSVSFNTMARENFDEIISALGYVVVVIIVSAGSLAFVVLYNLTNVNISERVREIATIKVLGFYDNEVANYIYRENIILTFIGTLVGLVMGIFLHKFIMTTVEMDNIMFGLDLEPMSYIYSVLLTLAFSVFVNFVMYYKLRNIPMVESLKSVD